MKKKSGLSLKTQPKNTTAENIMVTATEFATPGSSCDCSEEVGLLLIYCCKLSYTIEWTT